MKMPGVFQRFIHKTDPDVQTQIDALRDALIDLAHIVKEYEAVNGKVIRQIGETVQVLGRAIEELAEDRLRGAGGIGRENRWKQ